MGIKERQERERIRIRQAILSAARDLFVSEGYRNVSMRKIAQRIEYSPAAIYSYFPSKDDIFFALAEEGFRMLAERVLAAVERTADPRERLRRGMWAFYEFSTAHPEHFALMFVDRSVPSVSQEFQRFAFFQQVTARAEADLRACIERGDFSDALNPAAALHVLWVSMVGVATVGLARRLAPREDPDALAHDILESLMAGFSTVGTRFVAEDCAFHSTRDEAGPETRPADRRTEAS